MNSPAAKVSIIVTSYNIENYISQCLDCLINQELSDIEIIVVDDGSTDRSPNIIEEYAQRDSRIRPLLLKENSIGGVATAANKGLDLARGDYIGFADGDDIYDISMFGKLYREAVKYDADIAMCNYNLLDAVTGLTKPPADQARWGDTTKPHYQLLDFESRSALLRFIAVPWRKLYRRDFLMKNGHRFPVGDYFYEDNPFHWLVGVSAKDVVYIPEVLCQHRVARVGQTMSTSDERLFAMFDHFHTIHGWLKKTGNFEQFKIPLLSWVVSQIEWISRTTPTSLQRKLFKRIQPIIKGFSDEEIDRMMVESQKGERTKKILLALRKNSFPAYEAALSGASKPSSLVSAGLNHARLHGWRSAIRVTMSMISGGRRFKLPAVVAFSSRSSKLASTAERNKSISNEDIFVALIAIERRIKEIEKKINSHT